MICRNFVIEAGGSRILPEQQGSCLTGAEEAEVETLKQLEDEFKIRQEKSAASKKEQRSKQHTKVLHLAFVRSLEQAKNDGVTSNGTPNTFDVRHPTSVFSNSM